VRRKILELAGQLAEKIASWDGIEAITLNEAADEDPLNPNFALALDVYHVLPVPPPDIRRPFYGKTDVFEAAPHKDRFLSGDIPVHIEFKWTVKIEETVTIACGKREALHLIMDSGTYGFYRIVESRLLFSRGEWLAGIRKKLATLGQGFWNELRGTYQSKMEHFLSDLGAAVFLNDNFYFLVSASGFIKTASLTLFCINRRFEPSHRFYYKQICSLKTLPDSFAAQLETFLRPADAVTMERKYGVAQIIARGVVSL
jgi:hypothetical protein